MSLVFLWVSQDSWNTSLSLSWYVITFNYFHKTDFFIQVKCNRDDKKEEGVFLWTQRALHGRIFLNFNKLLNWKLGGIVGSMCTDQLKLVLLIINYGLLSFEGLQRNYNIYSPKRNWRAFTWQKGRQGLFLCFATKLSLGEWWIHTISYYMYFKFHFFLFSSYYFFTLLWPR